MVEFIRSSTFPVLVFNFAIHFYFCFKSAVHLISQSVSHYRQLYFHLRVPTLRVSLYITTHVTYYYWTKSGIFTYQNSSLNYSMQK